MRLTARQIEVIREKVHALLGEDARVRLFGSRVDDSARGGDIDLFVEVDRVLDNRAASASRLQAELQLALGDQRIDVVLVDPRTPRLPIHQVAARDGVRL
ncbi:hypothetical protein B1C78_16155 [Thioalkalivibrio denitrificans]|uniref:Polymerase nucleotidyl transferase domain-containing protein n=1 Tax=Thioalkalivibrio denitrificans TaxID=108003 RepID=A0A1V3N8T2_9GAMM|nr:nucleotidyltransferase domain-containing protein [Thioalkalivibrio denitrificans]OOG21470.1 hypothetical protein B1C78_16155 [Thioalkalivibrio denitrificans]